MQVLAAAFVASASFGASGATSGQIAAQPTPSADEAVRRAVQMELDDNAHNTHYMYRLHKVTPDRDETRECLETAPGTLCRVIAYGDQPLSGDAAAKEHKRIEHLVNDSDAWNSRQKQQKEDEERVRKMVAALPDAFRYQFDGEQRGNIIRLKFEPNPDFDPPSRELKVYQGMQGTVTLDRATGHMLLMDATLFQDVDFGWGILGRLSKGGHFTIEQHQVAPDRWETTRTVLDFNGKALLFKTIKIKETETLSDFRRVADNLSLSQGLKMLEEFNPQQDVVAQRKLPQAGTRSE